MSETTQRITTPRLSLAPMEGVTDSVLREVLTAIGGIDLCVTEFVRITDSLLPAHTFYRYAPELRNGGTTPSGVPLFVQLLGGQPGPLAENAAYLAELGAQGIDLNFGCPAKTVNRHDGGAALLRHPERIHAIVASVRSAVPAHIPVTAKLRLGFEDDSLALDNVLAVESAGAEWITLHARTRREGYKPPARWEALAPLRETLKIPLIANGEIWQPADYTACRAASGCEAVMLGRGLIAAPDLALRIQRGGEVMAWQELLKHVERFNTLMLDHARNPHAPVSRLKQWIRALRLQYAEAAELFDEIKRYDDPNRIMQRLRQG